MSLLKNSFALQLLVVSLMALLQPFSALSETNEDIERELELVYSFDSFASVDQLLAHFDPNRTRRFPGDRVGRGSGFETSDLVAQKQVAEAMLKSALKAIPIFLELEPSVEQLKSFLNLPLALGRGQLHETGQEYGSPTLYEFYETAVPAFVDWARSVDQLLEVFNYSPMPAAEFKGMKSNLFIESVPRIVALGIDADKLEELLIEHVWHVKAIYESRGTEYESFAMGAGYAVDLVALIDAVRKKETNPNAAMLMVLERLAELDLGNNSKEPLLAFLHSGVKAKGAEALVVNEDIVERLDQAHNQTYSAQIARALTPKRLRKVVIKDFALQFVFQSSGGYLVESLRSSGQNQCSAEMTAPVSASR
ncbi:MAG: hypothetical protein AAF202_01440 [Pseudomonadota bacterium]